MYTKPLRRDTFVLYLKIRLYNCNLECLLYELKYMNINFNENEQKMSYSTTINWYS